MKTFQNGRLRPQETVKIEALKKAHDLGIKIFVSIEPTIPGVIIPLERIDALSPWVDRWIIGALNYMGTNTGFYSKEVPKWLRYVKEQGLRVQWKRDLKPYLK